MDKSLFSSEKDTWETPPDLFKWLDNQFKFGTDVCADATNHKCVNYYSINTNGLMQQWSGSCWMNPPYGKDIGLWIDKAAKSHDDGATVVALVPARTDTNWWFKAMKTASEVWFLQGRLKFVGAPTSAPFPSALIIWQGSFRSINKVSFITKDKWK